MAKPKLEITTQVVRSYTPSLEVQEFIDNYLKEIGEYVAYHDWRYGSAYYVELPEFIEYIYRSFGQERALCFLKRCFEGNIPSKVMQTMDKHREGKRYDPGEDLCE